MSYVKCLEWFLKHIKSYLNAIIIFVCLIPFYIENLINFFTYPYFENRQHLDLSCCQCVLCCNGIHPQISIFNCHNHCFLNSYYGLKGYVCSTKCVLIGLSSFTGIPLTDSQLPPFASFCCYLQLIKKVSDLREFFET